jgi:hypothetical protein
MSIAQKDMVNFREVVRLGNHGVLGEHDPSTAPAVCHLNLSPELLMSIPWILVDADFKFKLSEKLDSPENRHVQLKRFYFNLFQPYR